MRKIVLSAGIAAILLSGCGIKPGDVSAPPHVKNDTFPRTYPDPSTDPAPERKQ
jgi:hypothetical protein